MSSQVFFKRFQQKEYHFIYVSEQDYMPIAFHDKTADKLDLIVEKDESGNPIIENNCLKIKLEKNHTFTNYETVLNKGGRSLTKKAQEQFLEVLEWVLDKYKNKGVDDSIKAEQLFNTPEKREKYLTDSRIKEIADYLYNNPNRIYSNPRLEDVSYLISERFPESNWTYEDTTNLPMSLLLKFHDYIENENIGWRELKVVLGDEDENEDEEENLGESSREDFDPESTISEDSAKELPIAGTSKQNSSSNT